MGWFKNILNKIRGINSIKVPSRSDYVFGTIISGTYGKYIHDPHPTILCLGCYQKPNGTYVHGIQLHALDGNSLNWLLNNILTMKKNNVITSPIVFFNNLKMFAPYIIKAGYRTYKAEYCDFKIINPGISRVDNRFCYPVSDGRDKYINKVLNNQPYTSPITNISPDNPALRNAISIAQNTVKVWK